ncbi:MAG: two-component sensor histidine kinase [Parafilimonas sp.]|nr:two-component sensor histidine kinase [Parafilimonas sp.]
MADLRTTYEVSQKQAEVNLLNQQKRNQRNILISLAVILCLAIIIIFISLKHNRNKQKAYKILNEQKLETEKQKAKAEKALSELQVTQKQLIQSEKMASLGQLTAGIAHEIQNPLNFVNNFSEVSTELLDELNERVLNKLTDPEKTEVNQIFNDLGKNLNTIGHHGKRADAIVKSLLQHSHTATAKRELTDINSLSNQYLQLSYHALQVKDSSFSTELETHFDNNLHKLVIMPQDIGRALLNIYNNAFYSVHEKMKRNLKNYVPKVLLTTKGITTNGKLKAVQIRVWDNGIGIPDAILDKIYQPFFTTKPTGNGIGLGLYLSYDIITNEHEGQLSVNTKEGEYTEFIIELPNIE